VVTRFKWFPWRSENETILPPEYFNRENSMITFIEEFVEEEPHHLGKIR
jgi:hypothetical protein